MMALHTRMLLLMLLVASIAIIPVLASRELVQNFQPKAKVADDERIHANTNVVKRMLDYRNYPPTYKQPTECPPYCNP